MSIVAPEAGPMAESDNFDQDWEAAKGGEFQEPTGQSEPAPTVPDARQPERVAEQPAPAQEQVQVGQFPAEWQGRLREVGAENPEQLFQMARGFQSVKGQLPNLEQRWREQHVTPIEQRAIEAERERDQLRSERQQALDTFITIDPQTGRQRTPQEQQAIRLQVDGAEAQRQQAAQQQRHQYQQTQQQQAEQQRFQQERQQLDQERIQVEEGKKATLLMVAANSLPRLIPNVAQQYNVPQADLDNYVTQTKFGERIQALENPRDFGYLLQELHNFAQVRGSQVVNDNQRVADLSGKYRDVGGGNTGSGGSNSGDRWNKANDQDFETAWKRALAGELA